MLESPQMTTGQLYVANHSNTVDSIRIVNVDARVTADDDRTAVRR